MNSKSLSSIAIRSLLLAVASLAITVQAQWSVKMATTNLSFAEFEFGTADGATAGWDQSLEDPLPPALPNGAISGFSVNGAPFPGITLQSFEVTGTGDAVYSFMYSLAEGGTASLDWSAAQDPSAPLDQIEIQGVAGANLLGGSNTMADVSELSFTASRDGLVVIFFVLGTPQPVARDDVAYMLNQGGNTLDIDVLVNDYSPTLAVLTVDSVTAAPANGDADVAGLADFITYDPTDAFFGVDSFKYKATDTTTESEEANVTVYVNENVVVRGRDDQEPGKPGEDVVVTVDVECDPGLSGLALEIVLPRTQQDPPQIWTFGGATYSDVTRGETEAPTVTDDGLGTVTLGFATLPTSLTLTLGSPDVRVASSGIVFDTSAESVANLETAPFPDVLPEVAVAMQFGTLDVNGDGVYDITDLTLIYKAIYLYPDYLANFGEAIALGLLDPDPVQAALIYSNYEGIAELLDIDADGDKDVDDLVLIYKRLYLYDDYLANFGEAVALGLLDPDPATARAILARVDAIAPPL